MNPSSDKNLLFALIAYHNGYINMEQFFEAAAVWNGEPKRELGEILVEKKFLDEVERFNIQPRQQNLWGKRGLKALNRCVFLDADNQH